MRNIFATQDLMVSKMLHHQILVSTANIKPDIVIVELPSDLNVYTFTNDDGTAKDAARTACCVGPITSDACRGKEGSSSCCSSTDPFEKIPSIAKTEESCRCSIATESNECPVASNARTIDLNEWASSFKIYAVKP